MLLLCLSKEGEHLNISRIAKELGYADDSSVNKRAHFFESKSVIRKKGLGWELTQEGRE